MMKNSDYSSKINEIYAKLLSEGKTDDVIRAINDQEYFEKIMVEHGLIDDSKWIASFWDRLVGVSKTGNISEFERLKTEKEDKIPHKLYRYRPILGNKTRYKNNPLNTDDFWTNFFLNKLTDNQVCQLQNDDYNEIMKTLPHTRIKDRISEIEGTLYCPHAFYLNDPYDSFAMSMKLDSNDMASSLGGWLKKYVRNQAHIASFVSSESPNSLVMWYSYAENYNGCCFEYDTDQWRDDKTCQWKDEYKKWIDALFPVRYSDSLLGLKDYLNSSGTSLGVPRTIVPFLTLKLRDWSYEHEWRIVLDASLLRNSNKKYKFVKNEQFTMPDDDVKKYCIEPLLSRDEIYNEPCSNNSEMRIKGYLLEDFPRPSRIYFPDIEHNRKYSYVEKGDLIYIAAQRKFIESIRELNKTKFKTHRIKMLKMRFTINGIDFEEIDDE
jgi:hypothetical protein